MRNVIITGGELFNKGAQAMTFIAVDELKKRFPNHDIYLLSTEDLKRSLEEREKYAFKFMGWYPMKFAKAQSNRILRLLCLLLNTKEFKECEEIYRNCDLMIDISGYGLGSVWSDANCNNYLDHIEFAKAFHIPVYLMPQSFGPFDFKGENADVMMNRCKNLLSYPKVICAREKEGYEELSRNFGLDNLKLSKDIVLNNKGIDYKNVFSCHCKCDIPEIKKDSVGIVPNGRILDYKSEKDIIELYSVIISDLLNKGKNIYLISHATADQQLCNEIKHRFEKEDRVINLEKDFSCVEFNEMVASFEFLVASRFHSIVHAFKNGIPCISVGWAVKYYNLLKMFNQEDYAFDIRHEIDEKILLEKMNQLALSSKEEGKKIEKYLADIQRENVFDILSE